MSYFYRYLWCYWFWLCSIFLDKIRNRSILAQHFRHSKFGFDHTFDTGLKLRTILGDLGHYLIFFLILTAAAFLLCMLPLLKKHLPKKKEIAVIGMLLLLSVLYQLFSWIFLNTGYEYLQLYLAVTLCLGLWFFAFRLHDSDTFPDICYLGLPLV